MIITYDRQKSDCPGAASADTKMLLQSSYRLSFDGFALHARAVHLSYPHVKSGTLMRALVAEVI